jgi:hypothetical protein
MSLQRREFFAILGLCVTNAEGLFAQSSHHMLEAPEPMESYQPRAFNAAEYELVDQLAETLLPADETGPGAHAAHVAYYLDVVLYHSNPARLQSWKNGLAAIEALTREHFGAGFVACSASQRQEAMGLLVQNEAAPVTALDGFVLEFKRTVIDGFYASQLIQREHLGYQGNTAIMEFKGCTHPNFEHHDIV